MIARRRFLARAGLGLLLIAGILIAVLLTTDRSLYAKYLEQEIAAAAAHSGTLLTFGESRLVFAGLEGKNVQATVPIKLPVFLFLSFPRAEVKFNPFSLLSGKLGGNLQGEAYDGKINGTFSVSPSGDSLISLALEKLALHKHPQLSALGVSGGSVSVQIDDLLIKNQKPAGGRISLEINGLQKPLANTVPAVFSGAQIPLEIPAIRDFSLSGRAALSEGSIAIEDLKSSSSLATLTGRGVFKKQADGASFVDFSGRLSLGPRLKAQFQPQLAAAALQMAGCTVQSDLTDGVRSFAFSVRGDIRRPAVVFKGE